MNSVNIKRLEAKCGSSLEVEDFEANNLIRRVERVLIDKSNGTIDLSGKRILNIGGGSGFEAEILLKQGARSVVILEIAPKQIEIARTRMQRARLRGVEYVRGDAEHLPFCDGEFDLSYIHMALHHLPDNVKGMTEACRVAKEVVFVDVMNPLITRLLNVFGLLTREGDRRINRVNGRDVLDILDRMQFAPSITYFFAPPIYTHNSGIMRCYFALFNAMNSLVNKSKLLGFLIGNIAIIRGANKDKTCEMRKACYEY